MTDKLTILKNLRLGSRVAEEEGDQLEQYFVETDQWNRVFDGDVDVIYGPKGSGKSAIYALLNKKDGDLFDKGILLAPAENVRGATVFQSLITDPPPSEFSFIYLWKLHFITIIGQSLRNWDIKNKYADSLVSALENVGLLPIDGTISAIFQSVVRYFKGWLRRDIEAVQYELTFDTETYLPVVRRKS